MAVTLLTFSGQNILPEYDAEARKGMTGFTTMPAVTLSGSNLIHLTECYGMIAGYQFQITAMDVPVSLPSSGTIAGALYLHLDTTNAQTPLEVIADAVPIYQYGGGVYDMEIARFTATPSGVSGLTDTAPRVDDPMILKRDYDYSYGQVVRCPSCAPGLMLRCIATAAESGTAKVEPSGMKALYNDGETIVDGGITWQAFWMPSNDDIKFGNAYPVFGQNSAIFTAPEDGNYLLNIFFHFSSALSFVNLLFTKYEEYNVYNNSRANATILRKMQQGDTVTLLASGGPAGDRFNAYYWYKKL